MVDLDELRDVPIGSLLTSGAAAAAQVAAGHSAPCRLRQLWPQSDTELETEREARPIPPMRLFALADVELRSDYMPYSGGVPVSSELIYPKYVKHYFDRGFRGIADVREVRNVDVPAFCVSNFQMTTYGHFLIEVLPKVLLARALQRAGLKIPIAFPSDAGAASAIVAMLCGPDGLLQYESRRECLRLSAAVLPSVMMSFSGMHDIFVAATKMLALEFAVAPSAPKVPGPRLFLSRSKWKGYRTLNNEAELFGVAAEYGFELVHPQDLPWPDQVRMFSCASHVISAYDSALHGTLFCPAGAKIISLGRVNVIQEIIGDSLGHELGFLDPVRGELMPVDPSVPLKPQFYEISTAELRRRLDSISMGLST